MQKTRNFFVILILIITLTFFLSPRGYTYEISFGAIGDTRIGVHETIYNLFLKRMEKEGIHLIFHTGDVINKPGDDEEWKKFLDLSRNKGTIHIAPGNHDINNYRSLEKYKQYIQKPPYYSFSIKDTQFILLCTEMPDAIGKITGTQLEWLKKELQKPFQYRFVFLHKPPFPSPFGNRYGLDRFPEERDILHELFVAYQVNLVFAGHEHLYNRKERDGITYVITGGGGAPLLTFQEEFGGFFHYIIAKRLNGGYVFSVHTMDGIIKDEFKINTR